MAIKTTYGGLTADEIYEAERGQVAIPPQVWFPYKEGKADFSHVCQCGQQWAVPQADYDAQSGKVHRCDCGLEFQFKR